MESLLRDRFGFQPASITVLRDEEATTAARSGLRSATWRHELPTATSGSTLGHGSQVPIWTVTRPVTGSDEVLARTTSTGRIR